MSCRVGLAVRSCVLAALLAVVGALGLVPMVAAPAVATGGGFAGPEALAFVSQGASRTQLTTVRSPASGGIAMDTVGPPGKLVYDALAYDQNDGYLYAITNDGGWFGYAKGQILKIARGGAISGTGWNIGAITGERTAEVTDPETGQRTGGQTHTFVAGTWGDGDYFVRAQGSTTIHRVSLAADVEAAQIEPTLDGAALEIGGDLVYVDGSLWSVLDDGRLARVSTADGAASAAAVAGLPAGSYGAQWLFPDGAFGASGQTLGVRADSGEVYQVTLEMTGPVATPRGPDTPAATGSNDGASKPGTIPDSGPDLAVTKTASPPEGSTLEPGDTVTYTLAFDNTGGTSPAPVDHRDLVAGVLDHATLSAGPTAQGGLTVGEIDDGAVPITGTVPAGEVRTVTYAVTIDEAAPLGEPARLDNFLLPAADETPTGCADDDATCTSHPLEFPSHPGLTLEKRAADPVDVNSSSITDAGDTIDYSFTVTNTGDVDLTDVRVSDPALSSDPLACSPSDLAPGQVATCGPVGYEITAADEEAGAVRNRATATAQDRAGDAVTSPESQTSTPVTVPAPALLLDKHVQSIRDANGSTITDAGDEVDYVFTVTNTGNVTIADPHVADPKLGLNRLVCTPAPLPPGEVATCGPASYTITPADQNHGSVWNEAEAKGTAPDGAIITSPTDQTSVSVDTPSARLALIKTVTGIEDVNGSGLTDAGDVIAYGFTVTNDGNLPISQVVVRDERIGPEPIECTPETLRPGKSATCEAGHYTVTEGDERVGEVVNTAHATGTATTGNPVASPNKSTTTAIATPTPALEVTKRVESLSDENGDGLTDAGDAITYSFTVTNTGNVPVRTVSVHDPLLGGRLACAQADLAPGESTTCGSPAALTYVVTEADEAVGAVRNTATAAGTDPDGASVISAPSSTSTDVTAPTPHLLLTKNAAAPVDHNSSGITDAGDSIGYTFTVTNTGNVPILGVRVTDPLLGGSIACTTANLPAGETATCGSTESTSHVVTPEDEEAGAVVNTATATGTDPDGAAISSPEDITTTPVTRPQPGLLLEKTATAASEPLAAAGDEITFGFTVTNTGNVPIANLALSDTMLGEGPISCSPAAVAPGDTATCGPEGGLTYSIQPGDVVKGGVRNVATATGTDPDGEGVTSPRAMTVTPVEVAYSALVVDKTISSVTDVNGSGLTDAGDVITYAFTVTNSGNVDLSEVTVLDTKLGGEVACSPTSIAVGAHTTCGPASYEVTASDEAAGSVHNEAMARGTDATGGSERTVTSPWDAATTPVTTPAPSLTLTKSVIETVDANGSGLTDAGDPITYSFTVVNTGNVPIDAVTVTDTLLGGTIECPVPGGRLGVGDPITCAAPGPYLVTQDDEVSGAVVNSAFAHGLDPDSGGVTSPPDITVTPVTQPRPGLRLSKTVTEVVDENRSGLTDAGDTVTYAFEVTNAGNVPLSEVTVADPKVGPDPISCGSQRLGIGKSRTCDAVSHTVTRAEVRLGQVHNTARSHALDPDGEPVTSAVAAATVPTTMEWPRLSLTEAVLTVADQNSSGLTDAGDVITYGFTVSNMGNVPLTELEVTEDVLGLGPLVCEATSLPVAAETTCTAPVLDYAITPTDVNAGAVRSTASARAIDPQGRTVRDTAFTVVETQVPEPGLTVEQEILGMTDVDGDGRIDAGDEVRFAVTITNTGNVPVGSIDVGDPLLRGLSCPADALEPGASMTCSPPAYILTQDDLDRGSVLSPAEVSGIDPDGGVVGPFSDTEVVDLVQTGGIELAKTGEVTTAGDHADFSLTVTNTGNVVVTSVVVSDPLLPELICSADRLTPGQSLECSGRYPISEADRASGQVVNTASAQGQTPTGAVDASDSVTLALTPPTPGDGQEPGPDTVPGNSGNPDPSDGGGGPLAGTGANVGVAGMIALALLGIGGALGWKRRRGGVSAG